MFSTTPSPARRIPLRRRWSLAVVLWAFGLATTTLLVGLWGRSVASDSEALSEGARAVLGADVVTDRVYEWLVEGIDTAATAAGDSLDEGLLAVAASPVAERAVAAVVDEFVTAALAPPGAEVTIDVAGALAPLIPVVAQELASRGVDVSPGLVRDTVAEASQVVLETGEAISVSGSAHRAQAALTTVLVAGIAALATFGALAVALAEDRRSMIRSLAIRLAVSALTFTLFLRIGAWAVDPEGGRSPLAAGGSVLLRSNHRVLLLVAAGAVGVALAAGVSFRRRRAPLAAPQRPGLFDDTGERELVGV